MKTHGMTKADIWMPFYVSDYLADTMHLSTEEHGAYLMLILHYWKSGPIPDDDARLALITKMGDAWSNASSTLKAFFKQCNGMLIHSRIDKERQDAIDNKDRNQARARAAASKRWENNAPSNATSIPQAMLNECPSPSPSPNNIEPKGSLSPAKLPTCPTQSIIDLYHSELPELPSIKILSEPRKKAISNFWKWVLTSKRTDGENRANGADEAMAWIGSYFRRAKENDFLMGRNPQTGPHSSWQCDLDFLLTEKGKKHVIEKTKAAS